ncbi:hypothetical protein K1W54_18485 [Micromonospora sp. CPCC 205371]|nr:hypothetical protein [Micromonospora sp. CPCC 205371]
MFNLGVLLADEDPVAAGHAVALSAHTKRLDIECYVDWLPKHTDTTNRSYSACMIPAGENSTGGGDLGEFYRVNRVLDWDAFTVAPGP